MRRVGVVSALVGGCLLVPAAATARHARHARHVQHASAWAKPQVIVPVGKATYSPAAVTAPNGTTVVIFDEANIHNGKFSLFAATRSVSGKIKIHRLGPMSGVFPQGSIAVGGDGTFAVAWAAPAKHGKSRVAARVWPAGKAGFGRTAYISPANAGPLQARGDVPRVAVDGAGTVYVVWEGLYGRHANKHSQVVERQLAKHGGKWSSPRHAAAVHCDRNQTPKCRRVDAHGAHVAANGNGNVAISWTQSSGEVMASIARAGAKPTRPQRITAATYGISSPSIAVSDRGKAAMTWEQSVTTGRRIESKVTTQKKFPRRGQFLSGKGTAQFQALALASDGRGVTAWEEVSGSGGQVLARVMRPRGRAWTSNIVKLTRPGAALIGSSGPAVAASAGLAFVAWSERLNNQLSVGVKAQVGGHWLPTRTYRAVGPAGCAVSAANDPPRRARVLGSVVWTAALGLQIAVFR